ncbi:phage holin family protein [Pengzhenrongella sicca]|uniref:Phage holin family protein n=1 Tax=Pengzhenrongella sicca TaxID=2819238 RepID=A0A8A4ZDP8_9MICO|nr:phage holin family protein [Pengzhenrongella sicca]QTE29445.1 phage holin family protein [Pengzhenrongella sicca]
MGFVLRVIINGIAIWFATLLLSGLEIVGGADTAQQIGIIALIALVFGIINAIVKPVVVLISLPIYILTLGLFTLVVNALMLMLTAWITEQTDWGLRVDSFGTAVIGALIISIVSFVLSVLTGANRDR